MDFFASQDQARRNTRWLVFLFVLAIAGIILVLWAAACAVLADTRSPSVPSWRPDILAVVTVFTLSVVFAGSAYKIWELRAGGQQIARYLGGRPVLPNTTDLAERRLLNVVEEMALAAGLSPPPVFVLDEEESINAFAAGYSPDDAVIGVNRGTLLYLTRDELQGVIAHEFSHILNGDMRLNLRLVGLLHGILVLSLIGRQLLMASRRSRRQADATLFVGIVLFIVGMIGLFVARLIKAAISREREYLADAAAVQFTRFPDGIAGALKKIGGLLIGSQMMHPAAEEASHMYFSMGFRTHVAGLFATHPPLVKRIRRIDPSFKGVFPKVKLLPEFAEQAPSLRQKPPERHVPSFADEQRDRLRLSASVALAAVGNVSQQAAVYINQIIEQMPSRLRQAAREPWEARCVLFALLWDQDARVASRHEQILLRREDEATLRLTHELRGEVQRLPDAARLPLVQLVQATLRHISKEQYAQFRGTVNELVAADERITLREFVLQHLVLTHLDRHFFKAVPEPVQYHSVQALQSEIALLLSFITHIGKPAPAAAQQAFQMGLVASGINKSLELVPWRECRLRKLEEALAKLRAAAPAVKKRILNGMFTVAGCDQVISTDEAELLRAIAEAIDCPMPPLVASHVAAEHA